MKLCPSCGQPVAESIMTCPTCGNDVGEGRNHVDDYRILEILHEGYSSILCKALKAGENEPVMIRIFTPRSGVDEAVAHRLKLELEALKKLPEDYFVKHLDILQSSDGVWYRVSEWIDAESWGNLLSAGTFGDLKTAFALFYRIAVILEGLHQIGHIIPHLILDDIIVFKTPTENLEIKIDYKLSRFLDPKIVQPAPMLKHLLSCHPDIVNQRPLDFRTDIWSLGKIFVELLTATHTSSDYIAEIEQIPLPRKAEVLLKSMLADDPALRPQSMADVAKTLSALTGEDFAVVDPEAMASTPTEIKGIKKWLKRLVIVLILFVVTGVAAWIYWTVKGQDAETLLGIHANTYAPSMAFVLAEYWLTDGENEIYRNQTEGTAFLVDRAGYLLTNRHVACPWLEDPKLVILVNRLRARQLSPQLAFRLFLWFEGQRAFTRVPALSENIRVEDLYFLESAYSTVFEPYLTIAGVAVPPTETWRLIQSPLRDDFAFLKIHSVPEGLTPLPLDHWSKPMDIPRLSPVIALGFPLGKRTQTTTVTVSVTGGHVRRSFREMIQVDTSIHPGNSGGPIIDTRGKVIGIASSVVMDYAPGPFPVATLLSDIGIVLPIAKAAAFLEELKAGRTKWNGIVNLSLDTTINDILALAGEMKWRQALELADNALKTNVDPGLILLAGVLNVCMDDFKNARHRFQEVLSINENNQNARWMLFLLDWLNRRSGESHYRQALLDLDWRSPDEFPGYLTRVLESNIPDPRIGKRGHTAGETAWLHYVSGLQAEKENNLPEAENRFKAALQLSDSKDWFFLLALARWDAVGKKRWARLPDERAKQDYRTETEAFLKQVRQAHATRNERKAKQAPLLAELERKTLHPSKRKEILKQLMTDDPDRVAWLAQLAFACAMDEDWEGALEAASAFLDHRGWHNANRWQMALLNPGLLHMMGRDQDAASRLTSFVRDPQTDPWYRCIGETLLGEKIEDELILGTTERPSDALTAYTAMGFWAEGNNQTTKAVKYYKEALGSYLDHRLEYGFARERLRRLQNR
ncbi:MAG: trypsin-like peptidase domain-containing protein [Desulfotignum sp.]|nr:trypsin-like peptidase domain-containing protein [Desulfotignum sp.]